MTDEIDTNAPERIWAVFEQHESNRGHPVVFASAKKTKGQEYVRADLYDAERQRAEAAEADAQRSWMDCNQEDLHFIMNHPEAVTRHFTKYRDDAKRWRQRVEEAEADMGRLRTDWLAKRSLLRAFQQGYDDEKNRADRMEAALREISARSRSYPDQVFPEPDLTRGIREIARAALRQDEGGE